VSTTDWKEHALVLNLRADHDEESRDDQPVIVQQHAAHHGGISAST
jgi:hypothetical protein